MGCARAQPNDTLRRLKDPNFRPFTGSSLQPKGTSVYRARIPAGTTLYHARYDDPDRIPSPEWFAFDIELSCQCAKVKDGSRRN